MPTETATAAASATTTSDAAVQAGERRQGRGLPVAQEAEARPADELRRQLGQSRGPGQPQVGLAGWKFLFQVDGGTGGNVIKLFCP